MLSVSKRLLVFLPVFIFVIIFMVGCTEKSAPASTTVSSTPEKINIHRDYVRDISSRKEREIEFKLILKEYRSSNGLLEGSKWVDGYVLLKRDPHLCRFLNTTDEGIAFWVMEFESPDFPCRSKGWYHPNLPQWARVNFPQSEGK